MWSGQRAGITAAAYTAKVRVSVRAGETLPLCGRDQERGKARASTPGQAHELALKGAETDATKRALATFGNPFGLALYDREQAGVRKVRGASAWARRDLRRVAPGYCAQAPASLSQATTPRVTSSKPFGRAMSEADDIELLYDVWEQNIETLRVLHRSTNERPGIVPTMVSHLRACAIDLVKRASNGSAHPVAKGNGWHPTQDRQERSHHQRAEAHPLQGASALCGKSALPHLRALTLACPPRALRAIPRAQFEGER